MKIEIAKEIIGACVQNSMYGQGICGDVKPPKLKCRSLQHLLRANRAIEKDNEEKRKGPPPFTQQVTVADRGLAAIYTALTYEGGTPDEPTVAGYANGNYVIVISESSLKKRSNGK